MNHEHQIRFAPLYPRSYLERQVSCCVLPVALLFLGFTSMGPFPVVMRYRPFTLTFSYLMLLAAFYVVYQPQAKTDCEKGLCTPGKLRRGRQIVWLSAGLIVLFTILASLPITMTLAG